MLSCGKTKGKKPLQCGQRSQSREKDPRQWEQPAFSVFSSAVVVRKEAGLESPGKALPRKLWESGVRTQTKLGDQ
jgi:hypothetical protein